MFKPLVMPAAIFLL